MQVENTPLLGSDKNDLVSIIRWMSFTNMEVLSKLGPWFRPLIGKDPFDRARMEQSKKAALTALEVMERHLEQRTFLVGDRMTLADFFAASMLSRGFAYVLDRAWRREHPHLTKWQETVTAHPSWRAVAAEPVMIDIALDSPPSK
jgi:elongation factor 1-gamma